MNDNIALILKAKSSREFRRVMTHLNAEPVSEILKELTTTKTEMSGKFEHHYSLLSFINERITPLNLKAKYPNIFAAAEILHPHSKIALCNLIMAEIQKEGVAVSVKDKHCLTLGLFVREGLHPQLLSCDSLIENAETDKSSERYALILFKLGFSATKASCLLLARKMFLQAEEQEAKKVVDILERIKGRYPEMIQENALMACAKQAQNSTAIEWLESERKKYEALKSQENLDDISFGKKKKKNGLGHQLAARKDSPRNTLKDNAPSGHELVVVAQEVLGRSGM